MALLDKVVAKYRNEFAPSSTIRDAMYDALLNDSMGKRMSTKAVQLIEDGIATAYDGDYQHYVEMAREVGLSTEHFSKFCYAGMVLMRHQMEFAYWARKADHAQYPDQIALGGGKGSGKSVIMFAQIAIDDCQRFPDLEVLYLRKTERKANEQFERLLQMILWSLDVVKKNHQMIQFANGSTIRLGGFKDEAEALKYQGDSRHIVAIEELPQLSESAIGTLNATRRTTDNFRTRMYTAFNPLGVSRQFVYDTFIQPELQKIPEEQRKTKAILSVPSDNKLLSSDYLDILRRSYTGVQLQAYVHGDFSVAPNKYFDEFSRHHTSDWTFTHKNDCPEGTQFFCGFDYGVSHPNVITLHCQFPSGELHTLDELIHRRTPVKKIGEDFIDMLTRYGLHLKDLRSIYAGLDAFNKTQNAAKDRMKSVAEQYAEVTQDGKRMLLSRAKVGAGSRVAMGQYMKDLLGNKEYDIIPMWKVQGRCKELIKIMNNLETDPNNMEAPKKVDYTGDNGLFDDVYDSTIYALFSWRRKAAGGGSAAFVD